ncbi:AraC family transcriptional regulator [Shinella sp. WSJ-2]|nr:AraC family transcriptional regulator [Shinella sp. WSJ-2]
MLNSLTPRLCDNTVASDVGYTSQSAFTHAFKRTTGGTPRSR